MKKRTFWIIGIVLVVLIAAGLAYRAYANSRSTTGTTLQTAPVSKGEVTVTISGAGTVRSKQSAEINWQTDGTVGSVSTDIGQQVQAGDELASLDPTSLPSSIIQAKADLIDAQTALEDLKKPQPLKIAQAQKDLEAAKTSLENLHNPSETAIAEAQLAVLNAQDEADTAQRYVDNLKYPRANQQTIAAAQAAYLVAQSQVDGLKKEYNKIKGDPTKNPAKAQALAALEASITQRDRALATLNWLQSDRTQEEIDQKYADLNLAKAQLADAQETLRKLTDPTAEDIALAEATVADAQETLDTLKAGPTENDLTVAQTRVTLAQAALAKSKLTAPFAGTITDLQVMKGDVVTNGTNAFRIDDISRLYVDLQISEVDIQQVKEGQKATLTFDAIADKEYHGVVTKIGMVGTNSQGVVNYPVTVEITDADSSILPSMTAAISIIVSQKENVLVVPNQAVRTIGGQRTVTVLFEGQQIQVPVTVGLVGDSTTEITSNALKEGDEVVINSSSGTTTNNNGRFEQRFEFGGPPDGGAGIIVGP